MEWRLAFTGFLLAFCAVVLADRVHGFSARLAAACGLVRPGESPGARALEAGPACDWYVHFHRSDLTGDALSPVRDAARDRLRPGARTGAAACRTRPAARPRLHV